MAVSEAARVMFRLDPSDPRHGTANGYCNLGCRCAKCKEARSAYVAASRANGLPLSHRAGQAAANAAAKWVRHNHPKVWAELLAEQYRRLGER